MSALPMGLRVPSLVIFIARLSFFLAGLCVCKPLQAAVSTHTVVRAETLSGIALRYGVTIHDLRQWNRLRSDRIVVGQELALAPHESSQYRVKRGDTLSGIALRHGLTVNVLRRLNSLDSDRIAPGQKLRVAATRPAAVESDQDPEEYAVRSGDTLSDIAQRFDVGLLLLRQVNSLNSDHIYPGQKLRLRPSRQQEGVHVVRQGQTLSEIALLYKLDVAELRHLNGIRGDLIRPGHKLRLKTTPAAVHIVERGDALWEIARAYRITVSDLQRLNGLTGTRIYPGQELRLHPESSKRFETYEVNRGDNLSEIAQLHQMSVAELQQLNDLKSTVIHPGQELRVRPLLGRAWIELSEIPWDALMDNVSRIQRIDAENGPYYGSRPRAAQQKDQNYFEHHPVSPLRTYQKARKLWKHFEAEVRKLGRLSDTLAGWTIVLDPGHGGLDPGAIVPTVDGTGNQLFVVEDEYVYDIALRTYVLFRLHGAQVRLTLLSPNHLIRHTTPPTRTFVNEKNEVYDNYVLNRGDSPAQWPRGSTKGLQARVHIARKAYEGVRRERTVFLSFHADVDRQSPEAPLVLFYESRNGRRSDLMSKRFARALLPSLGAGARVRGQPLAVLRDNPAAVKVLVELRNLAHVDHAWALRFEQLRHRDAEKVVRGVLDYARGSRVARR
ncbi:MAG: LysM peptidoglycan-binding domain-containing protein [Candidatus Latescibacterota bacterium]|nr:LysM peptidoglycan-binding domain-containing protein [Candidatus Latescibacterota bacterium]